MCVAELEIYTNSFVRVSNKINLWNHYRF